MNMKVRIMEQQESGEYKLVEKILSYSKEAYKEFVEMPELASIEILEDNDESICKEHRMKYGLKIELTEQEEYEFSCSFEPCSKDCPLGKP